MRGLFSEITKDRNKKKGEQLSTEEPLDRQNPKRKKGAIHRKHLSYAARRAA